MYLVLIIIINYYFLNSRTVRNMETGHGLKTLPDIEVAAEKFLKGFRSGSLGLANLDSDLVEDLLGRDSRREGNS